MLCAQGTANARAEFRRFERFRDVIHRAEIKSAQLVLGAIPRREYYYGRGPGFGKFLELFEQLEAICIRQPEVEQNQIKGLAADEVQGGSGVRSCREGDLVF